MCACIQCLVLYLHIPDDPSETLKINVKWLLTMYIHFFNAICVITISHKDSYCNKAIVFVDRNLGSQHRGRHHVKTCVWYSVYAVYNLY